MCVDAVLPLPQLSYGIDGLCSGAVQCMDGLTCGAPCLSLQQFVINNKMAVGAQLSLAFVANDHVFFLYSPGDVGAYAVLPARLASWYCFTMGSGHQRTAEAHGPAL